MLTKEQAARLRGLIARNARQQWVMGATHAERGMPVNEGIPERAEKAREAVYKELRALTKKDEVPEC